MGHSRRKRPTSGATLVRYRLARRWNPISSPSFDYQAGIPGCDGLPVSAQHAAGEFTDGFSAPSHTGSSESSPAERPEMGHDPS